MDNAKKAAESIALAGNGGDLGKFLALRILGCVLLSIEFTDQSPLGLLRVLNLYHEIVSGRIR